MLFFSLQPKHVSSIPVGGSSSKKRDSVPSASAFGDDERHFDVSIVEEAGPKPPSINGEHKSLEDELNPKFGTATLSKSAPVAEKIVSLFTEPVSDLIY